MILIENNHICCLKYQTKMLRGRAQLFLTDPRISYTKESSVLTEGEMSFTLYENTNMANTRIMYMYCYFETHMTWHCGLVLSVSDFGTRGPGSIPGWTLIQFFSFFLLKCKITSYKKYGTIKMAKITLLKLNYPRNLWGWG